MTRLPDGNLAATIFSFDAKYISFFSRRHCVTSARVQPVYFLFSSLYPSVCQLPMPVGVGIRYEKIDQTLKNRSERDQDDESEAFLTALVEHEDAAAAAVANDDDDDNRPISPSVTPVNQIGHDHADDDLDNTVLQGDYMEFYWRKSSEWLAFTTKQYRESGICHLHEPISKVIHSQEMRIGPRSIAVDGNAFFSFLRIYSR